MSDGISRRGFLKASGAAGAIAATGAEAEARAGAPVLGPDKTPFKLKVNGKEHDVALEPRTTLLNALRTHLDVTGPKEVCDRGACGACTVWVDGKPVNSCLYLAIDAAGRDVTTVEGLSKDGKLDPLQQKFCEHDGMQCGFCTPGFVMSIKACLRDNPKASLDEVKRSCAGNVCRCAAYPGIFAAAMAVAKGEKPEADFKKLDGAELRKYVEEKGVPRVDGPDKVSGRAKYTMDVNVKGMLTARLLQSPFSSATIEGEPDEEAAKKVPGVKFVAVLGRQSNQIGQPMAVAIAEDPQAADEALAALKLRLKPGRASTDPVKAFEDGNVRADNATDGVLATIKKAAVSVENTYVGNMVMHSALEPHGCVVRWEPDGNLTVWESAQHTSGVQQNMARAARLQQSQVHAICEFVGGGFGAKIGSWNFGGNVVNWAKDLGAPVKCMMSRAGELLAGGGRVPNVVTVKLAADRAGSMVAAWLKSLGRMGFYWYRPGAVASDAVNGNVTGIGPTPALRAPGAPPAQVVAEQIVDDLAAELGADPLDLRLKNRPDLKAWFDEGAKRIGWDRRQKKPGSARGDVVRGIGVGCGEFAGSSGCDFIEVEVDRRTGVVRVIKVVAIFNSDWVNRRGVINQIHGGTIMGLSWALTEERVLDGPTGAMLNTNFETYKVLGPLDVPEIEVVLGGQAHRPRGVGEAPVVPVAGALSNAIFNAIGARVKRMPFNPRNVLAAMKT